MVSAGFNCWVFSERDIPISINRYKRNNDFNRGFL